MKIALTQVQPRKGNIAYNIEQHKYWIEQAASKGTDIIAFSELSLTGYEPALATSLAINLDDERLNIFQQLSDQHNISIGLGAPLRSVKGIHISMLFFQPGRSRQHYNKQQLHFDEEPYFVLGNKQLILEINGWKIAPAICYESLQIDHLETAHQLGPDVYLASVAKSRRGVEKAYEHFPQVARQFQLPILMVNCVGYCDNFRSAGQSAVWDQEGKLIAALGGEEEGLLFFEVLR